MSVIEEALRLVHGARQDSYGHPHDDFSRTGQMWGAILRDWARSGEANVPPALVGLCMAAVKISREVNAPKADNLVDLAGYAEAVALVREREKSYGPDRNADSNGLATTTSSSNSSASTSSSTPADRNGGNATDRNFLDGVPRACGLCGETFIGEGTVLYHRCVP